jgi:predicted RNA-binding protein with PUA-like domain
MGTFLLKTEPGDYSYADLVREKTTRWTGVSNPAALAALRSMRKGDEAFIYHTGDEKAIVGLATVSRGAYEDPDRRGLTDAGEPKFAVVDLKPVRAVRTPLTLAQIKSDPRFKDFALVRQSRLSVMAVPPDLDKIIRSLTGL